jgi:hypothetical protein
MMLTWTDCCLSRQHPSEVLSGNRATSVEVCPQGDERIDGLGGTVDFHSRVPGVGSQVYGERYGSGLVFNDS